MGKPRDTKIAILPSTTRKGTTLSTSAALDSPSVISKLVSPPQASNAGTSAESENSSHNCDDASAVLDNDGSLGSFLDATIARSRQIENTETPNENAATPVNSPESVEYSSDDLDEDYVELDDDFIEKCNATTDARKIKKLLAEHAVRYKLSPDPKFATSPINIKDKDYDFSLDLSHIAIVEKTPFCGTEKESAVEHMIELSTLSGLFSDDVKMRTYFVAKNFPFSLKDDAKTWYNNLPPGSIKSPKELLDVFFRKYFPASAQHIALQRIYNFDQEDGEKLPEAWARFCSLIRAQPDHDLEKHDLLDIFYSGLTIESRAYLDSCAGCVFRKRTPDDAEELLAKIGRNHDDWSTPEPTPTPIVKKRGMIKLNDEDMREAKKSLKEKGIKPEDVKNLPPIEDLCEITPPSSMIEDPLYPEGHPKRVEQDSQLTKTSAPSKKKKKKHKNVVESSEPVNDPNSISISDAETESGNEHDKDNDKDDTPDKEEVEEEPKKHAKNKKYTKEDFIAEKHGLEGFTVGEPHQYAKLTVSVVQDFEFHRSQTNPMVRYKIYNKTINLPFSDFCAAIRVPRWGSCEKVRGTPRELSNLYTMICNGRSFSDDGGKISSIQQPAIRYFAYFVTKCVLARRNASKLSVQDMAFLAAALQQDRTYNLGALIACRLATNREKGGICGGLIASRLLAMHGVGPHHLDIPLSIEKLDVVSMIKHEFISDASNLNNLYYRITLYKKNWRITKKIEKLVRLPAPALLNLDARKGWSITENELNAYIERESHRAREGMEEAEEHPDSSSDAASSSYQHYGHVEPPRHSSAQGPYYHSMYDPPAWNSDPRWE
ncbi:hypothetical protein QYE76_022346 [Lolium multiflorum]|uniref:Retrotransposon gag domain-containing protein n=1 Tax=Lolium multiflorum TaxID=4521 RepID=A0AAD8RCF8_LOLMU|nr:hypothetical protein QYE76_022346 [Lolium multiflorum]